MIVEMKDIRNTDSQTIIREESMAAIRLMYICESDIDLRGVQLIFRSMSDY